MKREKVVEIETLARIVVDNGYKIHTELGPGLLESVYEVVLANRLERLGIAVERQKSISIIFDGLKFDEGFRADLIVGG